MYFVFDWSSPDRGLGEYRAGDQSSQSWPSPDSFSSLSRNLAPGYLGPSWNWRHHRGKYCSERRWRPFWVNQQLALSAKLGCWGGKQLKTGHLLKGFEAVAPWTVVGSPLKFRLASFRFRLGAGRWRTSIPHMIRLALPGQPADPFPGCGNNHRYARLATQSRLSNFFSVLHSLRSDIPAWLCRIPS